MANVIGTPAAFGLTNHGISKPGVQCWNLPTPMLVERIVHRREGLLAHKGAVVVRTGHHTGRSPRDKFIVREPGSEREIWWGEVNQPLSEEQFEGLHRRLAAYLHGRDLFVQDAAAGADPRYRLPLRVVSEYAWHSLFARNLFLQIPLDGLVEHVPQLTILDAPRFHAVPEQDGTRTEVFIALHLSRGLILIGGTSYAGEIKKSIFTVLNYLLPQRGVLSMHCSANVGAGGDVALFFGLSGTGKTTLSSDPTRRLIGDDEHGWGDEGIFNLEGGCYAKTIRLRADQEPLIWEAVRNFGTVLENVSLDGDSRRLDFDDEGLTENTRAAYPLGAITNSLQEGRGPHPRNLFFLTADAFGVLPPIARLNPEQAIYYFLSGYTSKLAGTEKGLAKDPEATFSACFSAPFLPLHPSRYAELLRQRIERHRAAVWLLNTGWTGGGFGVGQRIRLAHTRAMVRAALSGELEAVPQRQDAFFGLRVPGHCPEVPDALLDPQLNWADPQAYLRQAASLADQFARNARSFADQVSSEVMAAGPGAR